MIIDKILNEEELIEDGDENNTGETGDLDRWGRNRVVRETSFIECLEDIGCGTISID